MGRIGRDDRGAAVYAALRAQAVRRLPNRPPGVADTSGKRGLDTVEVAQPVAVDTRRAGLSRAIPAVPINDLLAFGELPRAQ